MGGTAWRGLTPKKKKNTDAEYAGLAVKLRYQQSRKNLFILFATEKKNYAETCSRGREECLGVNQLYKKIVSVCNTVKFLCSQETIYLFQL